MSSSSAARPDHKTLFESVKQVAENPGWAVKEEIDGVEISVLSLPNSSCHVFRGKYAMPYTLEQFTSVLFNVSDRKSWDSQFVSGEVIEEVDANSTIEHLCFDSGSMLVSNRDMLVYRTVVKDDDGVTWVVAASIEDERCPPEKQFVRAEVINSCQRIENTEVDGKPGIHVTFIIQIDFKGMVPAFLTNAVGTKQPLTLLNIRKKLDELHH
eukprot:EC852098.1.p1 GENE.EC852098.1~~EC852098.1.p1  ORF type:complete len:211 (+),score=65.47 EC852098.1:29-661(+)